MERLTKRRRAASSTCLALSQAAGGGFKIERREGGPLKASHGHDRLRIISQCRWALSSTFVALSQHTADYSGSSSTVTLNVAVGGPYHPPFCGNKGLARASLRALPGLWPAHTFPGTGHVVLACCLVECSSTMCHNTCKCVSPILQKTNKFK